MTVCISILLFLILLFVLWLLLICPSDVTEGQTAPFIGHAFAHRGLHGQMENVPENSLRAFRLAVESGYGIELDIALSRDGQVVVFHDDTLTRVCGVTGRIDEYDYEDLQKMSLNGTDEHIPLFSEVLALVAGQVPLIVEFKHTSNNKTLVRLALELLDAYDGPYCVESFNPLILSRIRHARPKLFRGQLSCRLMGDGNGIKAFPLQFLLLNFISRPHFIAYEHTQMRNISYRAATKLLHAVPVAWTVRSLEDFYRLFDAGIDIQIFEGFLPPAVIVDGDPDTAEEEKAPADGEDDPISPVGQTASVCEDAAFLAEAPAQPQESAGNHK